MDKAQYLLMKLAEECAEVAQRAIKQMQFGKLEIQPGQPLTNGERLMQEVNDLGVVLELLIEEKEMPDYNEREQEWDKLKETKIAKMQKYLQLSANLGRIKGFQI